MQFRTKEEQVADFLREGIIAGRIERGARLKQQEIATQLGTSITPVREALKLLEAEGYVAGDSFKGAVVAPFDIEASSEVLEPAHIAGNPAGQRRGRACQRRRYRRAQGAGGRFSPVPLRPATMTRPALPTTASTTASSPSPGMPQTLHFVQILWARYPFRSDQPPEGPGQPRSGGA